MKNQPKSRWVELKVLRSKDGHTLQSLAIAADMSISYLSQLESGARTPNERMIKRLACTLDVPVSMLTPAAQRIHQIDNGESAA